VKKGEEERYDGILDGQKRERDMSCIRKEEIDWRVM